MQAPKLKQVRQFTWGGELQEGLTYYPLGGKTLFMLILKSSMPFFFLFSGLIAGLFFLNYIPASYIDIVMYGFLVYIVLMILVLMAVIFVGWLEYFRYGISLGQKDLRIKKGLIATEEVGVPYRRIRDVKVRRSLLDQILGVSDIVIILSDFEEQATTGDESIIFLPSLEEKVAKEIQGNILKKSQVEQIDVLSGHDNIISKSDTGGHL